MHRGYVLFSVNKSSTINNIMIMIGLLRQEICCKNSISTRTWYSKLHPTKDKTSIILQHSHDLTNSL